MAVTYPTAVKTARMQAVVDAMGASAVLEIGTAAMASVLATISLAATPFTVSGAVATMASAPRTDTSADNSGTAAAARIRTGGATDIVTGLTVGTSGTDIILDSVSITAGQQVQVTSGTITHA